MQNITSLKYRFSVTKQVTLLVVVLALLFSFSSSALAVDYYQNITATGISSIPSVFNIHDYHDSILRYKNSLGQYQTQRLSSFDYSASSAVSAHNALIAGGISWSPFDGDFRTGYWIGDIETQSTSLISVLATKMNITAPMVNYSSIGGVSGLYSFNSDENAPQLGSYAFTLGFLGDSATYTVNINRTTGGQGGVFYPWSLPSVTGERQLVSFGVVGRNQSLPSYSMIPSYLAEVKILDAPPPPPPPPPPQPPTGGYSSFISFGVPLKDDNNNSYVLYYEDIVNLFYTECIEKEVLSYAHYPYNTVLGFTADGYIFVYFMVTDKPLLSSFGIAVDGKISLGQLASQGISGTAWYTAFPVNSQAGETVTFYATSAFGNLSPSDIITAIKDGQSVSLHGITMNNYNMAGVVGSFEFEQAAKYTVLSNYSLTTDTYRNNASIKQAFKFSESWARLALTGIDKGVATSEEVADMMLELNKWREQNIITDSQAKDAAEQAKRVAEGNLFEGAMQSNILSLLGFMQPFMTVLAPLFIVLAALAVFALLINKGKS